MSGAVSIKLLLGGDVMLGRLFNRFTAIDVVSASAQGEEITTKKLEPWSPTLKNIFQGYDGTIINLETTITRSRNKWPDKKFNYQMLPENRHWLAEANIIAASLANNHILDFQLQGLMDTQDYLTDIGIHSAGAGLDLCEAMSPAYIEYYPLGAANKNANDLRIGTSSPARPLKIGFLAAADHYADWTATNLARGRSSKDSSKAFLHANESYGIWYVPIRGGPHPEWKSVFKQVRKVRKQCDLLIFSLHWNSNWVDQIEPEFREFAHLLIENGVDIIHGHSPHHLLPIEEYTAPTDKRRKGIIFYSLGDLVDDYAVDANYRNDLGALAYVSVSLRPSTRTAKNGQTVRWRFQGVYPTRIRDMQVDIARSALDRDEIKQRLESDGVTTRLLY